MFPGKPISFPHLLCLNEGDPYNYGPTPMPTIQVTLHLCAIYPAIGHHGYRGGVEYSKGRVISWYQVEST